MAKGTLLNYSNLRGSIGGVTYSQNASGSYARVRKSPVNRNSAGQQIARNNFSTISQAFRTLTLGERQSFEDMRDFYTTKDGIGNTVRPTASQLFARINGKLLQNGIINSNFLIKICPPPVEVENTNVLELGPGNTPLEIQMTAVFSSSFSVIPADCALVVYATSAISRGITRVPDGQFKKIFIEQAGANMSNLDITSDYENVFGPVSDLGNIWVRVVLFNTTTGQESNYIQSAYFAG